MFSVPVIRRGNVFYGREALTFIPAGRTNFRGNANGALSQRTAGTAVLHDKIREICEN